MLKFELVVELLEVEVLKRQVKVGVVLIVVLALVGGIGALVGWANRNGVGNLIKTYVLIKSQYLKKVSTATLIQGAAKGMVDALGDPYSVYLDQEEYKDLNQEIEGAFGGIGVEIESNQAKQLVVVSPLSGTPAAKAGIKTGDLITQIDGKSTTGMTTTDAAKLLKGKPGTTVSLKIMRPQQNNATFNISLRREQISVPSVVGKILPDHREIAYLQVMRFNRNATMSQLTQELTKMDKAGYQGMILDLRGNPGGDLQTAVELASLFLKHGPVVRIVHKGGAQDAIEPINVSQRIRVPLVVLVDGGSASASEIVAGAIKDTKSGILVGTRTFGKGVVQTIFDLSHNEGVKLTTDQYRTPNGTDINKKGIEPDIVVEQPEGSKRDYQLDRAVDLLLGKLQGATRAAA